MLTTSLLALQQPAPDSYIVRWPTWVGMLIGIAIMGSLFASVAVFVRRALGPLALWFLALLPAAGFTAVIWPQLHNHPSGVDHWSLVAALIACIAMFALAPTATIWMVARRPSPPRYWRQVGLAVGSTYATILVLGLLAVVAAFGYRAVAGWAR